MSGVTNAPWPACGHPDFCEPGSPECLAKTRAAGVRIYLNDPRQGGKRERWPFGRVPMHPTRRQLDQLGPLVGMVPGLAQAVKAATELEEAQARLLNVLAAGPVAHPHTANCTLSEPCDECRPLTAVGVDVCRCGDETGRWCTSTNCRNNPEGTPHA